MNDSRRPIVDRFIVSALILFTEPACSGAAAAPPSLTIVFNWPQFLKKDSK